MPLLVTNSGFVSRQYQGIDRDITRRQRGGGLREGEQHCHSLIEAAPEAIFAQRQGRFIYLNPPMLKLFGADDPQERISADAWERVAPGATAPANCGGTRPAAALDATLAGAGFDREVDTGLMQVRRG